MKYKKIVLVMITLILTCSIGLFLKTRNCIGAITTNILNKNTSIDSFSFNGKENEKFKFTFDSNIKEGELSYKIVDADKNIIYEFPSYEKGEKVVNIEKDGVYTVKAEYTNFIGKVKLAGYKVDSKS